MSATKEDIRAWLEYGKRQKATHVIIVCDNFDYEDYPVYVMPHEKVREKEKNYSGVNMQKVMEVYKLDMDLEKQLNQYRAFNY